MDVAKLGVVTPDALVAFMTALLFNIKSLSLNSVLNCSFIQTPSEYLG